MERVYPARAVRVNRYRKSAATEPCGAPKKAASLAARVVLTSVFCIICCALIHKFLCYSLDLEWNRMQIEQQKWIEQNETVR